MSDSSTQFTFQNQQNKDVKLVIEPWALVEDVPGGELVIFEVNAEPPPEIEFSLTEDGRAYVYVMSERVRIHIDGIVKHDFKTETRPPLSAFRVLNKLLWSS